METIFILYDNEKLENPDSDVIYEVPDRIEKYTDNEIYDNGFDYISRSQIGIWLSTESAEENYGKVITYLKDHLIHRNDMEGTVQIYISEKDTYLPEECRLVYDGEKVFANDKIRLEKRVQKATEITLRLIGMITQENPAVLKELEEKISGLEDMDEQWQHCIDVMKKYHYVCQCDFGLERAEFVKRMRELEGVKAGNLPVNEAIFEEGKKINAWCNKLDEQWESTEFFLAAFSLEDNTIIAFPYRVAIMDDLVFTARVIGVRITYVAEI